MQRKFNDIPEEIQVSNLFLQLKDIIIIFILFISRVKQLEVALWRACFHIDSSLVTNASFFANKCWTFFSKKTV